MTRRSPWFRRLSLVAGSAVLLAPLALAAGTAEQKKDEAADSQKAAEPQKKEAVANPFMQAVRKPAADSKTKVYSNDDLRRLYGNVPVDETPPAAPAAEGAEEQPADGSAKPAEPAPDPLKELLDSQRAADEKRQQIAEAENRVAEARKTIAELDKRKLAIRNPLLARPAAPEGAEDSWKGMTGPERLEYTDTQMKQAQADLAKAEADLDALRRSSP